MPKFAYADEQIGPAELVFAVSSMIIGVGILTLPRLIASVTEGSDGWISILLAGMAAAALAYVCAALVARFPGQSLLEFAPALVTRPLAWCMGLLFLAYFVLFTSYITRIIGDMAQMYLFERTPIEVLALLFLLVVIYAVSGKRVGVLRLNMLFLPIILFFSVFLIFCSLGIVELDNLEPIFSTPWQGIVSGARQSAFSLLGFEIILFYAAFMRQPRRAAVAALAGIAIPVAVYLLFYLVCITVFSVGATQQVIYPTIELAKEIELPGSFSERFESLFLVIWIIAVFNTGAMAMDLATNIAQSLFQKQTGRNKLGWLLGLAPVVFIIAMLPQNPLEHTKLGEWIGYLGFIAACIIPATLLALAAVRGLGHATAGKNSH